jgi:hypothetical protein
MTRKYTHTRLTETDMIVICAGGRSASEFETLFKNDFAISVRCKACGILADALYRVVVHFEAGARRSLEASHRRLAADATA